MIKYVIRNYNDTLRASRVYDKIKSSIGPSDSVMVYDDGSHDSELLVESMVPEDLILNKSNQGELVFYSNIRSYLTPSDEYVVFIDSDDILVDNFHELYLLGVEKLRNDKLDPFKLDFRLNVDHYQHKNEYSFTHINSMAYSLIEVSRYLSNTEYLANIINEFFIELGYRNVSVNADSYLSFLLNLSTSLKGEGYNIVTNSIPVTYVIDFPNSNSRNIDRERFLDGYVNIYDNPLVKDRINLFRKICVKYSSYMVTQVP